MADRWRAYWQARALMVALVLIAAFVMAPAIAQAIPSPTIIQGYVYDGDTNEPVVDAYLEFGYWDEATEDYYTYYGYTDTDGFYAIEAGAFSEYELYITANGYNEYWDYVFVEPFVENTLDDFYLSPLVPTVEGDVVFDDTGAPFSDVSVGAYEYSTDDMSWWESGWTNADADGHWGMELPNGVYRFEFSPWMPQYRSEWFDDAADVDSAKNVTVLAGGLVSGIDAAISDAVPGVSGAIYDPDMAMPVQYADVILLKWVVEGDSGYWDWAQWINADENGEFTFYDVEPGGTYTIVCPASWQADYWSDTYLGDVVTEQDASSFVYNGMMLTGKDINIQWSTTSVWGNVWSSVEPATLPGVYVELWRSFDDGASWEWWDAVQTDWSGYYEFKNLPEGLYVIGQSGTMPQSDPDWGDPLGWWQPMYYDGATTFDAATPLTLGDGSTPQVDLVLSPAVPTVSGNVSRSTGAHEGVEGLEVSLFTYIEDDDAWDTTAWDVTDAAGDYEIFGAGAGDYKLGTWGGQPMVDFPMDAMYEPAYWDGQTDIDSADIVTVDNDWDTTQTGYDLVVDPASPVATGVLKDTHGGFISDGLVSVLGQGYWDGGGEWDWIIEAWSDENGAFALYAYPWMELPASFAIEFDGGPDYFKEYYNNKRNLDEATLVSLNHGSTVDLGNVVLDDYVAKASRLSGQSRYATAISIAKRMTNNYENVTDIILASGENKGAADPLAAAGLTWAYKGAPMVLSLSTAVPQETKDAVKQIVAINGEVRLHVVGGKLALPDARITELKNALGADKALLVTPLEDPTLRIAGANRFATAAAIADEMRLARPDAPDVVLIANGAEENKFVDALALSTIAAHKGAAILTVSRTAVPAATADEIDKLGIDPANIFVAGGPNTVDPDVLEDMGVSEDNRLAGGNRYQTATVIADWAISNGWLNDDVAGIAAAVPDALTGGAAVGWKGGPLLLTTRDYLWSDTEDYLWSLAPTLDPGDGSMANCYIFGGPNSISAGTLSEIDYILSHWME